MQRVFLAACAVLVTSVGAVASVALAGGGRAYVQPLWFQWEKADLKVVIVPPNHGPVFNGDGLLGGSDVRELDPYENSYMRATKRSVRAWTEAVRRFGPSWLRRAFRARVFVAGRDPIPLDADIVIVSDESKGVLLGIAAQTRPCIVNNSKMFVTSFTYADMYNVNAQEYGHCLGLDHSFGRPRDDGTIVHDVMYGHYRHDVGTPGNHVHCISNLNVEGLRLVFADVLGRPTAAAATVRKGAYRRNC